MDGTMLNQAVWSTWVIYRPVYNPVLSIYVLKVIASKENIPKNLIHECKIFWNPQRHFD